MGTEKMNHGEKVSINFSAIELGQIDLLIEHGFYTSRSDFIRTATRTYLEKHSKDLDNLLKGALPQPAASGESDTSQIKDSLIAATGVVKLNRMDLEDIRARKLRLVIKLIGILIIEKDVPVALAKETIKSVKVYGSINASDEIKEVLPLKK